MALDPNIFAQFAPQPVPLLNPLDVQAKRIAIQNALAQQQLNQQAIQGGALDLQAKQNQLDSQNALTSYYRDQVPATAAPAAPPAAPPQAAATPSTDFGSAAGVIDPNAGLPAAPPPAPAPQAAAAPPAAAPAPVPPPRIPSIGELVQRGVSPQMAAQVVGNMQNVDKTSAEIRELNSRADKANSELNTAVSEQAAQMADGILKGGLDPRLIQWHLQHFASLGPKYQQAAAQVGAQLSQMTPDQQTNFLASLANAPKQLEANAKATDAATMAAKANQEVADKRIEQAGTLLYSTGKDPRAYASVYARLDPATAAAFDSPQNWTPNSAAKARQTGLTPAEIGKEKNEATARALEAQRVGIEAHNSARSDAEFQQNYGDALGNMSPQNLAIAKALSTGDIDPQQLSRMKGKQAIMSAAIAMSAQNGVTWTPQIYATKKTFTDPASKESTNLQTISRIVGHLGRFESNSQALGVAPVYGLAGQNLGGTAKATAEDAHAISAELEKLTSGGVGSEGQIKDWTAGLRSTLPSIRQKAVDEISQLVGSQYEGMAQAYRAGTGQVLPVQQLLTPAAQRWMTDKGIRVETSAATPGAAGAPAAAAVPPAGSLQHLSDDQLFDRLKGAR